MARRQLAACLAHLCRDIAVTHGRALKINSGIRQKSFQPKIAITVPITGPFRRPFSFISMARAASI